MENGKIVLHDRTFCVNVIKVINIHKGNGKKLMTSEYKNPRKTFDSDFVFFFLYEKERMENAMWQKRAYFGLYILWKIMVNDSREYGSEKLTKLMKTKSQNLKRGKNE